MHRHLKSPAAATRALLFVCLVLLCLHSPTHAAEVGWRTITVPGGPREAAPTTVALYYPTTAAAHRVVMGPFTVMAAMHATPEASVKGLIMLSHGTGGSEIGHSSLAQALARNGYLVAALRHPGDNWQDQSLRDGPNAARYFVQRPAQVSHVIDALLQDPLWKDRIARDASGPRVGAIGHSAGGYTALALAGAVADLSRLAAHCTAHRTDDPIFCSMGRTPTTQPAPAAATSTTDTRVRAVVAMAPVGALLTATSLARIGVPTRLYRAEEDRFVVPRFHVEWVAQQMPKAQLINVPKAWHFAFIDTPGMPLLSPDGDLRADPAGFDRAVFLEKLGQALPLFFDQSW